MAMNFKKLADQANRVKDLIDQQGGSDVVKEKAMRVKDIATGEGTLSEKTKAAAEVAKERPDGVEGAEGESASQDAAKPEGEGSASTSKDG